MLKFLKNHWASIVFALCALAVYAFDIFAPLCSIETRALLGYFPIVCLAFFLGCGVNLENNSSWITFIVLSLLAAVIQCVLCVCLLPTWQYAATIICAGVLCFLGNFAVSFFAFILMEKHRDFQKEARNS